MIVLKMLSILFFAAICLTSGCKESIEANLSKVDLLPFIDTICHQCKYIMLSRNAGSIDTLKREKIRGEIVYYPVNVNGFYSIVTLPIDTNAFFCEFYFYQNQTVAKNNILINTQNIRMNFTNNSLDSVHNSIQRTLMVIFANPKYFRHDPSPSIITKLSKWESSNVNVLLYRSIDFVYLMNSFKKKSNN